MLGRVKATLQEVFNQKVLNPFDTVRFRGYFKPDSRSLHTSFRKKIKDTFQVFKGGTQLFNEFKFKTRPGLSDYATFGLFRIIHAGFSFFRGIMQENPDFEFAENETFKFPRKPHEKHKIIAAKIFSALPFALLTIAHVICNGGIRYGVSLLMTAICFPAVLLAHGISRMVRKFKEKKLAKNLSVILEKNDSTTDLHQTLNEINFHRKGKKVRLHNLHITKNDKKEGIDLFFYTSNLTTTYFAKKSFNPKDPTQKKQLDGLAELNLELRELHHGTESLKPRHR